MMNSNQSLTAPSPVPRWFVPLFILFSAAGFLDAAYLTAEHYLGRIPPCSLVHGCQTVLTSPYSSFLGIPVSLFGLAYYAAMLLGIIAYGETGSIRLLRIMALATIAGLAASLWFIYVQAFVIHAVCLYCLGSAATSFSLFGLGQLARRSIVR